MEPIQNPHDKLFQDIWSRPEEAQSFLEAYLPPEVVQQIDPGSLEICKDSFVDAELKAYFSDMLYKVAFRRHTGYIYVLFEHKSYPEHWIHLQILEYLVKIWRLHVKQYDARYLPIILPVVLYHGTRPWPYGLRLTDQMAAPHAALRAYLPDFGVLLTDLSAYTDDQLRGSVLARVVLLLFKHIFDADVRQKLPEILALLREVGTRETGLQALETILRYLASATDKLTITELVEIARQTLEPQGGDIIMTIAQQLEQKGFQQGMQQGIQQGVQQGKQQWMQEGRQQGRQEGLCEAIELGLQLKFGSAGLKLMAQVYAITEPYRLKVLKDALTTITDLAEFKTLLAAED